ncbi:MAG: hypothetical protein Ta2B_05390 [Termitinemataceae bacterium]|nr:MAG: hypothetical protein Ta2B_05390 [Termitinemataceae bacterium]
MINIDLKFLEREIELSNIRTDSLLNAIDRTQSNVNELKKYLLYITGIFWYIIIVYIYFKECSLIFEIIQGFLPIIALIIGGVVGFLININQLEKTTKRLEIGVGVLKDKNEKLTERIYTFEKDFYALQKVCQERHSRGKLIV